VVRSHHYRATHLQGSNTVIWRYLPASGHALARNDNDTPAHGRIIIQTGLNPQCCRVPGDQSFYDMQFIQMNNEMLDGAEKGQIDIMPLLRKMMRSSILIVKSLDTDRPFRKRTKQLHSFMQFD
jgi:hypothetical protein